MKYKIFFVALIAGLVFAGCQPEKQKSAESVDLSKLSTEAQNPNNTRLFYIFQDKGSRNNHYTPSGFMPNGECVRIDESVTQNCFSGDSCIKVIYDVECSRKGERWAGVYWLNPPNNWGKRKGGYNLKGATRLTFYARGERGGEQIQEFTMGGITGDYPDSDMTSVGPVILSQTWKQYTIDLRGKDLSYISGGFAWTTNVEFNDYSVVFYLDEIKFE